MELGAVSYVVLCRAGASYFDVEIVAGHPDPVEFGCSGSVSGGAWGLGPPVQPPARLLILIRCGASPGLEPRLGREVRPVHVTMEEIGRRTYARWPLRRCDRLLIPLRRSPGGEVALVT